MIILNTEEPHVSEEILGYIMTDTPDGLKLAKVVDRQYRHPDAPEHALVQRTEIVTVQNLVPASVAPSVKLMELHQAALAGLMNKRCQE